MSTGPENQFQTDKSVYFLPRYMMRLINELGVMALCFYSWLMDGQDGKTADYGMATYRRFSDSINIGWFFYMR